MAKATSNIKVNIVPEIVSSGEGQFNLAIPFLREGQISLTPAVWTSDGTGSDQLEEDNDMTVDTLADRREQLLDELDSIEDLMDLDVDAEEDIREEEEPYAMLKREAPQDLFGREVRAVKDVQVEIRQEDEGEATLVGHAAVFNKETVIGRWFREQIAPGAFTKTLTEADVRHLFNHDPSQVLGRNKAGTLRLSEDAIGLRYDVDLNLNDPDAKRVFEKVQRGDVSQSSFAFIVIREMWEEPDDPDSGELPLRTILEARLFDTSTVTYPAYDDTTALIANGARSAAFTELTEDQAERLATAISERKFTPDIADALRGVAQRAEEFAARCADGEPCPEAAEEAPLGGTADDRAAEEAPDGEEGTDRDREQDKTLMLHEQAGRNAALKARLAGIPVYEEVK